MATTATDFSINAGHYGIPTREELIDHRIWDSHYHGFLSGGGVEQHEATMFYVERMGIERVICLDIAGSIRPRNQPSPPGSRANAEQIARDQLQILTRDRDRVSGIIRINPTYPEESVAHMRQWIANGPCIGIKYSGGGSEGVTCSHPNNDAIVRLAKELDAVIYIHTWIKVGGSPRFPGGGNNPPESTPADVAILAQRFPDVPLICGHSGGDWELGARAIRPHENVFFEFSGSDPHSGQVDYAVNLLGADRIVWGGHGPSRSYATELSKVLDSGLNKRDRMKVLGTNYRRIAQAIFRKKGYAIEV